MNAYFEFMVLNRRANRSFSDYSFVFSSLDVTHKLVGLMADRKFQLVGVVNLME